MHANWLAAASIAVVACGTTPVPSSSAKPVPPDRIYATEFTKAHDGSAFLVVTRDSGLKGKACTVRFYVDGTHVADLRTSEQVRLFVEEGEHLVGVSAQGCLGGSDQMSIVATLAKPILLHIQAGHGQGLKIQPSAF